MIIIEWLIWLVSLKQIIKPVLGEFLILSGPQFQHSKWGSELYLQTKQAFCVTDEINSALIWNIKLDWQHRALKNYNKVSKTKEISDKPNEHANKNFNCQMTQTSACSRKWTKHGDWNYSSSLEMPMSPVFGKRWEDFLEVSMMSTFQKMFNLTTSGSFSVSIRGSENAQFALCNENNSKNDYCVLVILGKLNNLSNITTSTINSCENGIIASSSTDSKCSVLVTHNAINLSEIEWKTFTFKWNFQINTIDTSVYDNNNKILNYSGKVKDLFIDTSATSNQKINLLTRSSKGMLMKFHTYYFLKTSTENSTMRSPEFMPAALKNNICIEMSISLCRKCTMHVSIIDNLNNRISSQIFENTVTNYLHDLPKWQIIKFKEVLPASSKQPVSLEISTLISNRSKINNPYWLVSEVQQCNGDSLKVTKYDAFQDLKNNSFIWPKTISCQKISWNGSSTILYLHNFNKTSTESENMQQCAAGKIGSSCLVPCSELFPNTSCQSLIGCDINGCYCGQGFVWPKCEANCPKNTYGHYCKQRCGNCLNDCYSETGHCIGGCNNTEINFYLPPYCKEELKYLSAPVIVNINTTSVKLSLNLMKELKGIAADLNIEIWKNSSFLFASGYINVENKTTVEFFQNRLLPRTDYKTISILRIGRQTLKSEWVRFTTSIAASPYLNVLVFLISSFVYLCKNLL